MQLRAILLGLCGCLGLFAFFAAAPQASAAGAPPVLMAADNQTACGAGDLGFMQERSATVMRLVVSPNHVGSDEALRCVQAAALAGYKVYLSMIFDQTATPQQDAAYFAFALPRFAPYLWAISIGNEQELQHVDGRWPAPAQGQVCSTALQTFLVTRYARSTAIQRVAIHVRTRRRGTLRLPAGWRTIRLRYRHRGHWTTKLVRRRTWRHVRAWRWQHELRTHNAIVARGTSFQVAEQRNITTCRPTTPAEDYRRDWNAIEPIVAALAPQAIRVFGEASGFGAAYIKLAYEDGPSPPGAQAIAYHCYRQANDTVGLYEAPEMAEWAGSHRLPLWCSEMAPGTHFPPYDTWATWNAEVADIEQQAPNLRMVSYYRWPFYTDL